jgi:hypothetical protein
VAVISFWLWSLPRFPWMVDLRVGRQGRHSSVPVAWPVGFNLAPVLQSVSALLGQFNRSSCPCGPAATHDLTSESLRGGVSLLGSPWHPFCN